MIIYYKRDCKRQTLYLLSYIEEYSRKKFETKEFDPEGSFDEIENTENSYVLFSNMMPRDLTRNTGIISKMKEKFGTLRINVVLGGTLFLITNNQDVLENLPEVTHVCVGKGETFLKELIEDGLPRGIYHGKDFPQVEHYRIKERYLHKMTRILITFDDSRCTWNKCKFCHHNPSERSRKRVDAKTLVDDVAYYRQLGLKEFYFYDNLLDPGKFYDFLRLLYEKIGPDPDISFRIFGARIDSDFSIVKSVLWKSNLIDGVSLGAEFYSQALLNLYNKGITKEQIDKAIKTFLDLGASVGAYLLFGVPGERTEHIEETRSFVEKYGETIIYIPSFFRLSPDMPLYEERASFKIQAGPPYKINEMVGGDTLPPSDTR